MMSMKKLKQIVGIMFALPTAIFITAMSISPSYAVDGKNYPGLMCIPYVTKDSFGKPTSSDTPYYNGGAIGNPSVGLWLYVNCPAIKDHAPNINKGWVRVVDQNRSYNINCNLNSLTTPNSGVQTGARYSSLSGNYVQVLSYPGLRAGSANYYWYTCKIPPAQNSLKESISYVISYSIIENE